jgi:pimeloyl-ACP methyl ester carboxylesterase
MQSLIFTHGFGDSARTWEQQVRKFGRSHDSHVWDLPGHGVRATPTGLCRVEHAVDELGQLVLTAHPAPVLVGHSAGGYLTLRLTALHPERVGGLVLVASGPGFRNPAKMADWNAKVDDLARAMRVPPEVAPIAHINDSLVIDSLSRLDMPTLIVVGGLDHAVYRSGAVYLSTHLPHTELVEIPDAGHHVHRTHAATFNAMLAEFAQRVHAGVADPDVAR